MFKYNVKLALKSMRRNPVMTALMVAAIAVGIGVSMTTLTVYYLMGSNPIPEKSDVLFAITMDSWDPIRPFDDDTPERAPHQVTYHDAERLKALGRGKRQTAMFESSLIIEALSEDDLPFAVEARVKTSVNDIFKDVKFFHNSSSVDSTPSLMDYVFKSIGLDNVDAPEQKLARAKLWNVLCHRIWREINKLKSNKITTFYSLLKSK